MQSMNEQNFIENQLVILTKQTLDIFLKQENPADLIALYTFYYYTAKWQSTNQIKCTTQYVANGLHWSEGKVRKVKKQLIEFGLIEDTQSVDKNNRITGHYIKMNYIFKKETIENIHPYENPQGGKDHRVEKTTGWSKPQGGNSHSVENLGTNALSAGNVNALSAGNVILCAFDNAQQKNTPTKTEINDFFESVWKLYPCKKGKGQVSDTKKKKLYEVGYEELGRAIERYKVELEKDASWRKPQNGSTFFNSGYIDYLDCNYAQETEQRSGNNEHGTRENNEREIDYARTIQEGLESGLVTEDGYFNWE